MKTNAEPIPAPVAAFVTVPVILPPGASAKSILSVVAPRLTAIGVPLLGSQPTQVMSLYSLLMKPCELELLA